ncbi:hypothetical protein [Lysinibacillus xylanilyticus]|uniref:hypothetical protein n=1 Tax=Lysinibacillus xylanilyticus TaxID=582475 RepID=UPI003CFBFF40
MNFETKYLIRWGIPGWIFILALTPYVSVLYFDEISKTFSNRNLLVIGTFLTIAGVPLGYFFNQLHHLIGWVFLRKPKKGWDKYFKEEIEVDNVLAKEKNEHYRERYRYLLAKKHEVGSVLSSFIVALIIVLLTSLSSMSTFEFWYSMILIILVVFWYFLRDYASANIDMYFDELLKASRK